MSTSREIRAARKAKQNQALPTSASLAELGEHLRERAPRKEPKAPRKTRGAWHNQKVNDGTYQPV